MTSVHAPKAKTWGTSLLIKQRERAACPQLRCVPPDLRGDGARHASRESLPPSKPCRPLEQSHGAKYARNGRMILPNRVIVVKCLSQLKLSNWTGLTCRGRDPHNARVPPCARHDTHDV